jgi:hypothetical protein
LIQHRYWALKGLRFYASMQFLSHSRVYCMESIQHRICYNNVFVFTYRRFVWQYSLLHLKAHTVQRYFKSYSSVQTRFIFKSSFSSCIWNSKRHPIPHVRFRWKGKKKTTTRYRKASLKPGGSSELSHVQLRQTLRMGTVNVAAGQLSTFQRETESD